MMGIVVYMGKKISFSSSSSLSLVYFNFHTNNISVSSSIGLPCSQNDWTKPPTIHLSESK